VRSSGMHEGVGDRMGIGIQYFLLRLNIGCS
jgi:hypothetical protein